MTKHLLLNASIGRTLQSHSCFLLQLSFFIVSFNSFIMNLQFLLRFSLHLQTHQNVCLPKQGRAPQEYCSLALIINN